MHSNWQSERVLAPGENEKRAVQTFYDEVGWQRQEPNVFTDTSRFADLRTVSREYLQACRMRAGRLLARKGTHFLDAASGPVPVPEYLSYSQRFQSRICVDISRVALSEARKRVGPAGRYVLADVCRLPFRDDSFDAATSLHTIYHVPAAEQADAVREIHRVLAPGKSAVIVYSWGHRAWLSGLPMLPLLMFRAVQRRIGRDRGLYFHAHSYAWFRKQRWGFPLELRVWRSLSTPFLKVYVHDWLFGRRFLRIVYRLEERFPQLFGRFGQYPMFVIRKEDAVPPGTRAGSVS